MRSFYLHAPVRDTYANIIAMSPQVGDQAKAINGPGYKFICYTPGVWMVFLRGDKVIPPDPAGWTWDNQGTSTVTSLGGAIYLEGQPGPYPQGRIRYRTAPVGWSHLEALVNGDAGETGSGTSGLNIRESSTGKIYNCGIGGYAGHALSAAYHTNATAGSAAQGYKRRALVGGPVWLSIDIVGIDMVWSYREHGAWREYARKVNVFGQMAGSGPDQIGFVAEGPNGTPHLTLLSWEVT